jgi:hypothetical protein
MIIDFEGELPQCQPKKGKLDAETKMFIYSMMMKDEERIQNEETKIEYKKGISDPFREVAKHEKKLAITKNRGKKQKLLKLGQC